MEKVSFACMVVFAAVMVGVVQISFVFLLITLSSVLVVRPAFGQSSSGVRLEAGIAKEEADGDLKAAMTVYQQIASDSAAPRAVRAKALLRLARCDEKLGQQARQLYEQIVRDYADQPVAAQARNRLVALKQQDTPPPSTMTVRQIEMPQGGSMGVTDTDGQRAVYRDDKGNLYFSDLATHSKRLVFKNNGANDAIGWQAARDFSSVFVVIPEKEKGSFCKIAIVNIAGSGFRDVPRTRVCGTFDWSRDKRFILATDNIDLDRFAIHKIVLLDTTDGSERVLVTVNSHKGIRAANFSPDGRFVAFDLQPETGGGVFVVPIETGQPELVSENSQLLDWTSDGRFLVITNSQNGAGALSLLPIANGKAAGDPLFIRFGQFDDGYITERGSLVYSTTSAEGRMSLELADLDAGGRPGPWQNLNLRLGNKWNPGPSWSPDSQSIVYTSRNDAAGHANSSLILRQLSTGVEREIYTSNDELSCAWSSSPDHIFCAARDKLRTDFLRVDLDSKKAEPLGTLTGRYLLSSASRDEDALYLYRYPGNMSERWELATGKLSSLDERFVRLSNDDKWLVRVSVDLSKVEIRPIAGGDWRTLVSDDVGTMPAFTLDSRWVLFTKKEEGRPALFRVPVMGGTPERLGGYPECYGGTMHISPDGNKIVIACNQGKGEDLSILENFIPKATKTNANRSTGKGL
jgi:Tol biopolymer transport system component